MRRAFVVVLFVTVMIVLINMMDARASNRHLLNQLAPLTFLAAPVNLAAHGGTPYALRSTLAKSPIIRNPSKRVFPGIDRVRAAFATIREEALGSLPSAKRIDKDLFFAGIADKKWKRFYLKWYGPPDPLALKLCPKTCALLEDIPEVKLGMFSILEGGSRIPPHHGPARMCLRYHLGLQTPNSDDCFIQLKTGSGDFDTYSWRDGEDVVFDDTVYHRVQNNTDKTRIVLFLDIARPQNSLLLGAVTNAAIKYAAPMTTRSNNRNEIVQ